MVQEFTVPPVAVQPQVGGLADSVFRNAEEVPDAVVLARRSGAGWEDVTAARFRDEVTALAKGLLAEGVRFGDRVGIMSRTRYEWTLFDYALWTVGAQPVPIYPTSSPDQVRWMLHDSGAVACVVEGDDHTMTVGSVVDRLPRLVRLWQLDKGAVDEIVAAGRGVREEAVRRHRMAVTPDSVATVIYTSGTTGRPKGCVITHSNLMTETDNLLGRWEAVFRSRPGDEASTLLFLPLAHVFGRMVEVAAVRGRVRLGHQPSLASDDLIDALASFRPTFVLGVPYVFEKVFHAARRRAEAAGRVKVFDKAAEVAVRHAEALEEQAFGTGPGPSAALRVQHGVYEALVYRKVRDALGGRVRYGMSGGSAMERRLGLFFAGAGVTVYEGYGLTETTAAVTANPPGRTRFGTVGQPVPGTSVWVADDGEIWIRGGQVFSGYLNDPRATAEVLRDGWLATGDLGSLDGDGYLTITGRRKEILVTSGGKSLSPTLLEEKVRAHPLVAQCVVVGNDRPYVAALITLDPEAAEHWQAVRGRARRPLRELVRDEALQAEVRRAVAAANTAVSRTESIRAFRVLPAAFTEERGLLTPSLKLKRRMIETVFAEEIAALYRH